MFITLSIQEMRQLRYDFWGSAMFESYYLGRFAMWKMNKNEKADFLKMYCMI